MLERTKRWVRDDNAFVTTEKHLSPPDRSRIPILLSKVPLPLFGLKATCTDWRDKASLKREGKVFKNPLKNVEENYISSYFNGCIKTSFVKVQRGDLVEG